MLIFFATWCPPCREEIPEIIKIYDKFSKKDLEVLAINATGQDSIRKVKKIKKKYKIPYTILLDKKGSSFFNYKVSGIPTNIIIDKAGIIRYRDYTPPKNMRKLLKNLNKVKN